MPGLCKIRHAVALMSVALVINGAMLSSLSATDCNGNGRADVEDIALGESTDCNASGVPDECELAPLPFGATVFISVPGLPRGFAAADFDLDGVVDLAVSTLGDATGISILHQRSRGEFGETVYLTTREVRRLAAVDVHGDGAADVVAIGPSILLALFNRGDGTFTDPATIDIHSPRALDTGDLDGDGDGDLVVATSAASTVTVLSSNADGTFSDPVNHAVGFSPGELAVSDIDGDGDLDVAGINLSSGDIALLWNDGEGTLTPGTPLAGMLNRPRVFTVADLDGDTLPDIAVAGRSLLAIALNQGQGSFSEATSVALGDPSLRLSPHALEAADVDGDGALDLVVGSINADTLRIVHNAGDGTFNVTTRLNLMENLRAVVVEDLDGDGSPDLIGGTPGLVQVLFGDIATAVPAVPLSATSRRVGDEPHSALLKDIDGDGDLDFVANDGETSVMILPNTGNGSFGLQGVIRVTGAREMIALAAADLDNDGDVDFVAVDQSGTLFVLIENDGEYQQNASSFVGGFRSVTTADLDGDGFQDIAAANPGSNRVVILLNRGNGSFREVQSTAVGCGPVAVATGDLDGDGHVDLAVAGRSSARLSLVFGDGQGMFPQRVDHDVESPNAVMCADINADGDLDVAVGSSSGVTVLDNSGNRQFLSERVLRTDAMSSSVIPVDLDGDGLIDLAGANGTGSRFAVMLNRNESGFWPPSYYLVGRDPRFVHSGDLDGDGDADLVSADHSSSSVTTLINDSPPQLASGSLQRVCTTADFFRVATPSSTVGAVKWFTKYVTPVDPENPALLPTLFQDVERHQLHQEFLADEFPGRFPLLDADVYDQLVGRRATRQYFVGVMYLLHTGEGPFYGFSVLASFFADPAELPTLQEVRGVYETLRTVFTLEPLVYFPDTPVARQDAATWPDPGFPIHFGDTAGGASYQAYTSGTGCGRVRILDREAFQEFNSSGRITFQDILVLSEAPRDIEGVVGGIITATPQGELSHVAVRTNRRGTPNAFVADALEAFADLNGKLVRLVVEDGGYTTAEVTPEEASSCWAANRPTLSKLPSVDADYTAIDSFAEMDLSDDEVVPEARHGGKATNLARLQRILDGPFEEYREMGFSVPVHYYLEFLRSNTIRSAVEPDREVTYEAFLQDLADWPEFQSDSELRFDVLDDLRDHMRDHGRANGDLVARLASRIEAVFGTTEKRVRFRSSSNIEDILEFNGAGLYDSTSACVPDDFDDDTIGPSLCDPTKDNERGVERALKEVWRSLWTFRAHEERAFFGVPQETSAMGILVSRSFPDEIANGVAFTGNPTAARDRRYVVTAQEGEVSVVSPDPGVVAEKNLLRIEDGEVVEITRAVRSSLVPLGGEVLSDAQLEELGALLWHIDTHLPVNTGNWRREDILLDVEFKIEPNGDLAVKQVRPFLQTTRAVPTPEFELVIPADATACGIFVQSRSPRKAYELKSSLRLAAGRFALPSDVDTFQADLIEEVRLGPAREIAVAQERGTFRVTSTLDGGITTYRFRYDQSFTLADGTPYEIQLSSLAFAARNGEPIEASRVLDDDSIARDLVLQGNLGLVVIYGSCRGEEMPLWEIVIDLEDGSRIVLLERHEPPPTINDTGPASLLHAALDLAGTRRTVSDYWNLIYTALRHNRGVRHWVVLDPPATLAGVDVPVRVIEVVAPEPRFNVTAAVNYLDADFEVVSSPPVASYGRELFSEAGVTRFLRGDVEADGVLNLTDAVALLRHLFRRGQEPLCGKAADADDNGRVNIADAVSILHHLFRNRGPLPEPSGSCGVDLTADNLPCVAHQPCTES